MECGEVASASLRFADHKLDGQEKAMTSVERLNSVIERENVSSQTFDDLEKSLNQGQQQEPEKGTDTPPDNAPNPSEPQVTGDDGGNKPPEAEKGGAAGGQNTPNEPSVEKTKDTDPNNKQQHTPEEKREYAWQKLRNENKTFRTKNEQLTQQIKELQSQIDSFKQKSSEPQEKLTRENFATEEDWLRYLSHDQNMKDFAALQNKQNEGYLKQLQEQQRMLVIAEREEALFPAEKRAEYVQVVNAAMGAGMKSALENNPDIMQFIDNSQMGPRILYHFAMMPKDMIAIAENPNPASRQFMLANLERGLYNHFVLGAGNPQNGKPNPETNPNPAPNPSGAPTNPSVPPKKAPPPVIGKVGGGMDNTDPESLTEQEVIKAYRRVTT